MDKAEFVSKTFAKLSDHIDDPTDVPHVISCLGQCFEDGFTLLDAVRFTRLTEHVSPNLPEKYACQRMSEIMAKYKPRKLSCT